jgi:CubicO group peptidase (beta-lactamase class C family)
MGSGASLHDLDPVLAREIESILEGHRIPAAALAVVRGEEAFLGALGVRRVGDTQTVTPTTGFDVGSCSKAYVATAAALLVAEGQLALDAPVREVVPELEYADAWLSEHVTFRDLLSNRIGLARHVPLEYFMDPEIDVPELLRRVRFVPQGVPFRDRLAYSNHGFMAVALAVSRLSGLPYARFLEQRLFAPLGMRHSASGRRAFERLDDRALGYTMVDGRPVPVEQVILENCEGAGGVYSCAADAARWLRFWLDRGRIEGTAVVPEPLIEELHSPHVVIRPPDRALAFCPPDARHACYCLGWSSSDFHGHRMVQHAGGMIGFRAQTAFLPDAGIGVAVYLSAAVDLQAALAYRIVEHLLGHAPRDWLAIAARDSATASQQLAGLVAIVVPCKPGARASLDLEAYTGRYAHPASGAAVVERGRDGLVLRFRDAHMWDAALVHLGEDVFEFRPLHASIADNLPAPLRLRFVVEEGRVRGLQDLWGERYTRIEEERT